MEIKGNAVKASWFALTFFTLNAAFQDGNFQINRHSTGDIFIRNADLDSPRKCTEETCIGLSSGTATASSEREFCTCRCYPHLPAFREDLRICIDDIHECMLAPFVSGSTSQQIPFVFLPLKGQIVNPSKEISISGMQSPICAVSGAKFMTEKGWTEIRNATESDVPFRIIRDDNRLFLQWVGDSNLRSKLAGRLVMMYLTCKETEIEIFKKNLSSGSVFTPCVAFRVAGTPRKPINVSEVAFVTTSNNQNGEHLSVSEYVTIGISSVLLGLIYVASVFLYLHLRKRNKSNLNEKARPNDDLETVEEGIIKSNPLLSMPVHFIQNDAGYSDTTSSDNEITPDIIRHYEDRKKQTISAMIHQQLRYNSDVFKQPFLTEHQDSATNERLPEENVSIIETIEGKEDRPENIKTLGTARKKLYFNPAYFEPQLLIAPPPAALEFLSKIREVIAIAKQKMASKRFVPSLNNIPEEDNRNSYDLPKPISRQSSVISLKRENSRRKTCTGCPGCEPRDLGKLPELPAFLASCHHCTVSPGDSKQNSIRKWLEDVPIPGDNHQRKIRTVRTPIRNLENVEVSTFYPSKMNHIEENIYDTVPGEGKKSTVHLPPPDMIQQAIEVDRSEERVTTLTKKQMNAVINEFTEHTTLVASINDNGTDYEADSLERVKNKSSSSSDHTSQSSPNLSIALPDQEEMTMQNAVINKRTISTIPVDSTHDDHEYELIVMKRGSMDGYSLVSEVYVNNGFNYGSIPSTPVGSAYSTLEKKTLKVRYEEGVEKPGKLLIEVEDCADHYIPVHESDGFEPDTLDRKPKGNKGGSDQILLRTTGSFRSDVLRAKDVKNDIESGNFNRVFGSLREIYEAKTKGILKRDQCNFDDEKGRILTLEERHSKRQRAKGHIVPPDVIPPPPLDMSSLQRQSKWSKNDVTTSKNYTGRSASAYSTKSNHIYSNIGTPDMDDFELCLLQKSKKNGTITRLIQAEDVLLKRDSNNQFILHSSVQTPSGVHWKQNTLKPEDGGYLSTDSNECKLTVIEPTGSGSETDESLGDGQSESGAESVETHSVFFNRYTARPIFYSGGFGSIDSGVNGGEQSSSDSETVSYTTVVPVTPNISLSGNSVA